MEMKVVVWAEDRRERANDFRFIQYVPEFRDAWKKIVVPTRTGFIKRFQFFIHPRVKVTRQIRLQLQVAFDNEALHRVVVEQVRGMVSHGSLLSIPS